MSVETPEDLPTLPAAIEVAAYRIVLEALTNCLQHAGATSCRLHIAVNGGLLVEVADNGKGLPQDHRAGVGMATMREWAEEVGGVLSIDNRPGGGVTVTALLPLPANYGQETEH